MAVTINARGTSVSTFRFGKSGNFIGTHAAEGLFTSTDGNIANLTTIKVGPPIDADDAASRQYVLSEIANVVDTISAGDSSIVVADAGSGSIAITIDASTVASFTSTRFDLTEGIQISAGNGTVGAPAYTFETDLDSGLLYQPAGGPNSEDQVVISSDGLVIQKWRVQNTTSGVDYLVTEASLGEAKILVEGASTNADLELSGKGTGLVIAPVGYDMSSGGTTSFATKAYVDASGGGGGIADVVDDTTPQLGGNLDVNGNSIISANAGDIAITPDTTGSIILDGLNWPQADGTSTFVLVTDGAGQLSWTQNTPDPAGAAKDQVNIAINAFRTLSAGGLSFQTMADGMVDEFIDETGVDTGTSTNEVFDSANDLYANFSTGAIAQGDGTPLGNMTGEGGLAVSFDGVTDAPALAQSSALGNNATPGELGKDWGASTTFIITQVTVYAPNDTAFLRNNSNVATVGTLTLQGSTDNFSASIVNLGTISTGTGVGNVRTIIASDTTTAYRYHRVFFPAVSSSSDKFCVEMEFEGEQSATAMTLQSNAFAADFQPNDVLVILHHEENEATILNTDAILAVSRDGGTTFTNVTLEIESAQTVGNILTASVDISGQPSGTSMKWKLTTTTTKQKLRAVSLDWSTGTILTNISGDTTPTLGGELNASSNKIINLTDPTADQDAATKIYVDNVLFQTQSKSAAYTTVSADDIIFVDTTGGTITITLGSAVVAAGKQQIIKDIGGNSGTNNITVDTETAETIDGVASQIITNDFESLTVVSDGTNWFII